MLTNNPNAAAATYTGAASIVAWYVVNALGWNPPDTIKEAVLTLAIGGVLFIGRRSKKTVTPVS